MLTIIKPVYYCEFCKRHWMKKAAAEKHESRCIYNPSRTVCGWHDDKKPYSHAGTLAVWLRENIDVDGLRIGAGGCPACMVAAVVQAKLDNYDRECLGFSYTDEVERFRAEEAEAEAEAYGFGRETLPRIVRAHRDETVYERPCPDGCGRILWFIVQFPPIPKTLYGWTLAGDDEDWLHACDGCGAELPDGPWEALR